MGVVLMSKRELMSRIEVLARLDRCRLTTMAAGCVSACNFWTPIDRRPI
jgi:hypothetical protein